MVAEENDRGILGNVCKIADKLLHRLVRAAHERQVGVDLLIPARVLAGQADLLLKGRISLALIAAMVLHGDVEQEERLSLRLVLVQLDDLLIACAVAHAAADALDIAREAVLVALLVEAERLIDLRAVPRGRQIRVHRDRLVILRLQSADKARHLALDVHLIR